MDIGRTSFLRGKFDIGVQEQVILFVHHWPFATDEQQRIPVIQHPHLRGIQQLPPGDLPVGGVIAAASRAFTIGVQINGLLAQVRLRNHFVGTCFVAAQIEKFVTIAQY